MLSTKSKKKIKFSFFLISIGTILIFIFQIFYGFSSIPLESEPIDGLENPKSIDNSGFNILQFWQREIERVNNTNLNLVFGENLTLRYENPYTLELYQFEAKEIYFDSPNWVGAPSSVIKIHGYILYPETIKSSNPGCLCMHGLLGEAKEALILAKTYLEKGFIVMCHDHPGHGTSEGAEPSPSNFLYEGEYNKSAHFYLSLCSAIQGLRVLENLTIVNNSEIMVTGASYGGLNAMWLASICGERILGVLPYISIGDIAKTLDFPSKMLFWILGKKPDEIPNSYLQNQNLRFDPIYYLSSPKLPPILWQIGTNDDFFHYRSIKGTYDTVLHNDKFLQIFPNEHHGFPGYEDSTEFFINYVLNKTNLPPKFEITNQDRQFELIGDTLNLKIKINSSIEIESVEVCVNFVDIPGYCWRKLKLMELANDSWQIKLNPTIINSRLDYYFIINLGNGENIWFSSNIFSEDCMISTYSFPFVIIIIIFIVSPLGILIWKRYDKITKIVDIQDKIRAKKYFFIEIGTLIIIEFLFYLSLFLPWFVYESGDVIYTHFYIFNNLYTWKLFLGELSIILTTLFFMGWIINSEISFIYPTISGLLKMIYPISILIYFLVLIITSGVLDSNSLISNFGVTFPGVGLFLMILTSLATLLVGFWKKQYEIKLGLRSRKKISLTGLKHRLERVKEKLKNLISK